MAQMATVRKVKTHDTVVCIEESRVGVEVGGRSGQGCDECELLYTMMDDEDSRIR